jgi:hypothetical protein
MMSCEETRQTLSSYLDDCVSLPARVAIDEHLDRCPVCRAEVAELRSLTRSLSLMARPKPPADLADTISDLLTIEAAARRQAPPPSFGRRIARFLEPRLMPYSIGSFASVILFTLMFAALRPHVMALREAALAYDGYNLYRPVTSQDLAKSRAPFGEESPSLNPEGALAAMTRAYAHPHESNHLDADEMVVIANVFSDGTASLADVVQPPRDLRMLEDFESALRQDRSFVKASLDRRPDTMRVVFSIGATQKVNVDDRNY